MLKPLLLSLFLSAPVLAHDGHAPEDFVPRDSAALVTSIERLSARFHESPEDARLLARLGQEQLAFAKVNAQHEDYAAAEASFRALVKLAPRSIDAHLGLAHALFGQHHFREALEVARGAAPLAKGSARVVSLLGDLHFALGNYEEAEALFGRLQSIELTLGSLSRGAQIAQVRGRRAEARRGFEEALEAGELLGDPAASLAWCHSMLADLDLEEGRVAAAEAHVLEALELEPGASAPLLQAGRIEVLEGELGLAEDILRPLCEAHPVPRHQVALADLLELRGEHEEASRLYDKAEATLRAEVERGDLGHLRELAQLLLTRGRAPEEARAFAELDLEVRHDAGAYETLAWASLAAGHAEQALEEYQRAVSSGVGSVRLLCRGALILDANGYSREAALVLHEAGRHDALLREELEGNVEATPFGGARFAALVRSGA